MLVLFLNSEGRTIDHLSINQDVFKALGHSRVIINRDMNLEFINELLELMSYIKSYGYDRCDRFDKFMIENGEYEKLRWFLLQDISKLLSKFSHTYITKMIIDNFGVPEQC